MSSENTRKALVLYFAMVAGIVLGFGVSIVNTRYLTVEDYGKFKFIQQLFSFVATVTSFGFAYSAGRLVTQEKEEENRHIIGSTFIIHCIISICVSIILFVFTYFVDDLFKTRIGDELKLIFPFVSVGIFVMVMENLLQGTSKIYSLALFRVLPRILYIFVVLIVVYQLNRFSLQNALVLSFGITGVVISCIAFTLKPKFIGFRNYLSDILKENSRNGFHVYVGALANVGTANMLGLFLAYFVDMRTVGYYSLALITCAPLQFLPSVIGTTLFKKFASQDCIHPNILRSAIGPVVICLIIFLLTINHIIVFAYTTKYIPAIPYIYILAFGMTLHGFGDLFNRFLGAHGRGKELRNVAFLTGAVLVVCALISLPIFGAYGAVWTKTISSCVYFFFVLYYYGKMITQRK